MKIIVGLGNPGREYEGSRHNIGFRIIDFLNKEYSGSFNLDKKSNSETSEIKMDGGRAVLAKPQTFVNKSGEAVKKLAGIFKIKPQDIIIIHDDLDIPFGKTKISFGRSSAGHKGVESIIGALKTGKFYRLRIGTFNSQILKIKKTKDKRKRIGGINNFVIGSFSPSERSKLSKLIKNSVEKLTSAI